jgi:hypothetical protein
MFLGIILDRTKAVGTNRISHTGQAPVRAALFASASLLADDTLLLYLNWNGIGKQGYKVWASCASFFSSEAKLTALRGPCSYVAKKKSAYGTARTPRRTLTYRVYPG